MTMPEFRLARQRAALEFAALGWQHLDAFVEHWGAEAFFRLVRLRAGGVRWWS